MNTDDKTERPPSTGVAWVGAERPPNLDPERDTWNGQPVPVTLTDFLLARIAEDETVVRSGSAAWEKEEPWALEWASSYALVGATPARVLAECEAKRQIIDEHKLEPPEYVWNGNIKPADAGADVPWGMMTWRGGWCWCCTAGGEYGEWSTAGEYHPCLTLRALASVYADHPDYRDEWR